MTNVVTNIKDLIETEDMKNTYPTPKIDAVFNFLTLKAIANKTKPEIEKYTDKNKKIRNGKTVLAGTRITTKELMLIMSEDTKGQDISEYIFNYYPSIDSEEKILYGALYEIRKTNTLFFILKVLFNNKWKVKTKEISFNKIK